MNILHWMKREDSGLARSTLELAIYEERAGHGVQVRQPDQDTLMYGQPGPSDIHSIHSQINIRTYHDGIGKVMWMHGEPLSSVGNGVSMKAIVDLAPMCDAFICMRKEEQPIWDSIKRTYYVPKGVDLEYYHPMSQVERLSGEPAVLYVENWRGQRNPLYLCIAMQLVHQRLPNARLHLLNCPGGKMEECFKSLIKHNKWWTFIRTISGPQKDVNQVYAKGDIVVSCLYPLYARGIEALAAGKAFIGPGYRETGYPWTCDLDPISMADCIVKCWENYGKVNYRKWAEDHHDVRETVKQSVEIYEKYAK